MNMIPKVKCSRCQQSFPAYRSYCPNCGTRRVAQSRRSPSPTPSTVKGTVAYERAETNTKWQLIFGIILVVTVILAVIVMVSTSLEGTDIATSKPNTVATPPVITDAPPEVETPPTPPPTPTPTVEKVRIMFYEQEKDVDFLMHVGDDPIPLTAQILPMTIQGVKVNWKVDKPEYLEVKATGDLSCEVSCIGAVGGGVKLTCECLGVEKTITVYCVN